MIAQNITAAAIDGRQPAPGGALPELLRYALVSAGALAVDVVLLLLLVEAAGLHYLLANVVAFAVAGMLAWQGAVRWVFRRRRLASARLEGAAFLAIGVAGLAVNEAALWLLFAAAAVPLLPAKLGAAGLSFAFNFLARRQALFR